jgi:acyl-CoA dehydrogenase
MLDFTPTDEQVMLIDSVRAFIAKEMAPHEEEVEKLGYVPPEIEEKLRKAAIEAGLYLKHLPEEWGGLGLDAVTSALIAFEFGRTSAALAVCTGGPTHILTKAKGEQIERYLKPALAGERKEAFALTEPNAGSDARNIQTRAVKDGDHWVINGRKHFISEGDLADFFIVMVVTGEDDGPKGKIKRITSFLVDKGTPGFDVKRMEAVCTRGYNPTDLTFDNVRVHENQILDEEGKGFDVANDWLYAGRVAMAANCVGRARRALEMSNEWAASRRAFGQTISRFQGVSFKIADMATEIRAAELMTLNVAWKLDQGTCTRADASMCKLFASEVLGRVVDHAVQIFGGMGMMMELPIQRFWRDARVERIWEGTSEIQRHIISRDLLRPYEQRG